MKRILVDPAFYELMQLQEADRIRMVVSKKGTAICRAEDHIHKDLIDALGNPEMRSEILIERNAYIANVHYFVTFPDLREAEDFLLIDLARLWEVEMRRIHS